MTMDWQAHRDVDLNKLQTAVDQQFPTSTSVAGSNVIQGAMDSIQTDR